VKIIGTKQFWFFGFGVLVGAFSVFRGADTGNPVQNSSVFGKFTLFRESEGLI